MGHLVQLLAFLEIGAGVILALIQMSGGSFGSGAATLIASLIGGIIIYTIGDTHVKVTEMYEQSMSASGTFKRTWICPQCKAVHPQNVGTCSACGASKPH